MRVVKREFKVFPFKELTKEAQERVLDDMWGLNVDYIWWESIYEDAERIGCKISSFDINQGKSIDFQLLTSMKNCSSLIRGEHGKDCLTYTLALEIEDRYNTLFNDDTLTDNEFDMIVEDLETDFRLRLAVEYLSTLTREYEFLTCKESIIESIEVNEYEFLEDGILFS